MDGTRVMEADGGSRRRAHVLATVGGSCSKRLVLEANRERGGEEGKGGERKKRCSYCGAREQGSDEK